MKEALQERLGRRERGYFRTNLEIMHGIQSDRAELRVQEKTDAKEESLKIDEVRVWQLLNIGETQKALGKW